MSKLRRERAALLALARSRDRPQPSRRQLRAAPRLAELRALALGLLSDESTEEGASSSAGDGASASSASSLGSGESDRPSPCQPVAWLRNRRTGCVTTCVRAPEAQASYVAGSPVPFPLPLLTEPAGLGRKTARESRGLAPSAPPSSGRPPSRCNLEILHAGCRPCDAPRERDWMQRGQPREENGCPLTPSMLVLLLALGQLGRHDHGCPLTPSMLVLLLALVRADVVTVEIPEALIDGDIPANAAAYCRQHDLGPTPRGVACADAVLLDAGASLGRRSLARAARGDADGAVEDARRRTEIARQDADAWRQYGLALLDRNHEGDARDAAAALELAVAGDPTDLGAAHSLARASPARGAKPPAALRVATFASDDACGLRRLLASARHHHVEVDVLGANRTWYNGLKLELLRDFCASLSEDTLVVAVDGYDVVVTGGRGRIATRIQQLLERHPGRVVASADQTFYFRGADERCVGAHYPAGAQPYRFLNSGGLAGRAGDLEKVAARALRDAEGWDGVSDQTLLHRRFLAEAAPCDDEGRPAQPLRQRTCRARRGRSRWTTSRNCSGTRGARLLARFRRRRWPPPQRADGHAAVVPALPRRAALPGGVRSARRAGPAGRRALRRRGRGGGGPRVSRFVHPGFFFFFSQKRHGGRGG